MDRIQELLSRVTELSDEELNELRDLVLTELEAVPAEPSEADLTQLEQLAEASDAVKGESARRETINAQKAELLERIQNTKKEFSAAKAPAPAAAQAPQADAPAATETSTQEVEKPAEETVVADAGSKEQQAAPEVPEGREVKREKAKTTVIRAGADLPGISMGSEFTDRMDLAAAMAKRIDSMRGIRGGDGDKFIVATAELVGVPDARKLFVNDAEGNTKKVTSLVAAGGLGAPEEVKYDLFDLVGDTDRPVKSALPVFTTERGGIRFMRPPTLNDVNGVVGIWTVADDIDAVTDDTVRKPSFRVVPGPEVVVDTQAITMIMTFGNLMTRAYPELVARHNELALVAHARVAEQQLLTQIGALSTRITTRTQTLSAVRETLMNIDRAIAGYRNRHRMNSVRPLRLVAPQWFLDLLRADIMMQHPGDGLDIFEVADAQIQRWLTARNVNVTWTLDGEAGQDYSSITSGDGPDYDLADFPENVVWYLFAEGTFSFMDGGTLDLGLVRDSTLNAANDYQTFVETFENIVKFGHESLRVVSPLRPTGQGTEDTAPPIPAP